MILKTSAFLVAITSPALAAQPCPTAKDAMAPGVSITFNNGPDSHFIVSKGGKVTEDTLDDEPFRYETLENIFFLRYGPLKDGTMTPDSISDAQYPVPVSSLPSVADGINWKGHVTYVHDGETDWETDMTVSTSPYPDLQLSDCRYAATLITISETSEEGTYVTYLAFLTELGISVRIGAFSQGELDQYTPMTIGLIGDE